MFKDYKRIFKGLREMQDQLWKDSMASFPSLEFPRDINEWQHQTLQNVNNLVDGAVTLSLHLQREWLSQWNERVSHKNLKAKTFAELSAEARQATEDWLDVTYYDTHRFYPPQCPVSVTAAPETPRLGGPGLLVAPNPFNPSTRLSFDLLRAARVDLRILDLRGRLVATLHDGPLPAGGHHVDWHGRDDAGRPAPSGVYHARLTAAGATVSRKVSLVK